MMVFSRIAKSGLIKQLPSRLLSPRPSLCGYGNAGYPYSTLPSKTRKNKATPKVDQPKTKEYIIHNYSEIWDDVHDGITDPISASPLVQVFSVSINTNFDDNRPCELYGSIRTTEGADHNFSLYDRDHDNPETILKHGNLLLNGPQCDDFSCSLGTTTTKIELCLKDKTRNIEFVKGQLNLDSNTEEIENSYDKLKTAIVGSEHGFASVNYATFRFALFAFVEVAIFAKYDVSRPFSEIYGSITAGYANSKSYSFRKYGQMSSMNCTLFNKSPNETVMAAVDTPISLSRYIMAVPVHSSLKIEAHLWDSKDGPFASGSAEFLGHPQCATNKLIQGEGGSLVVAVTWENAYDRFYAAEELRVKSHEDEVIDETIGGDGDAQKKAPMLEHQQLPSPSSALSTTYPIDGYELIEVFSIFVDSKASEVPAVCGWVKGLDSRFMFNQDISDPKFCSKNMLPLGLEDDVMRFEIRINPFSLYLKDPVFDSVISKGVPYFPYPHQYDKRHCSVIHGPHGYAAVHYTIFCCACKAFVEMTIINLFDESIPGRTPSSDVNIYGSVFARYRNYNYSSVYDKKYYQSRLFDTPECNSVELTVGSKLPLLKLVVPVSLDDSLIIEANLWATSKDNSKEEAVFGTVEFEVHPNSPRTNHRKIQGQSYCIDVSLKLVDG